MMTFCLSHSDPEGAFQPIVKVPIYVYVTQWLYFGFVTKIPGRCYKPNRHEKAKDIARNAMSKWAFLV